MKSFLFGYASLLSVPLVAAQLTTTDFLRELVDRDTLARTPAHDYSTRMWSSYERTAVEKDKPGWFGNADYNQFVRIDTIGDEKQYVLMDAAGPGVITRFWVTTAEAGHEGFLNIYLDGETEPSYTMPVLELISGGKLGGAPLSINCVKGHNLYLPISYAKHCKVTYTNPKMPPQNTAVSCPWGPAVFYYNFETRTYTDDTTVKTLTPAELAKQGLALAEVNRALTGAETGILTQPNLSSAQVTSQALVPNASTRISFSGSQAVRTLRVKIAAKDLEQALRSTVISMTFDGEQTVWSPVGDFFGTGYRIRPFKTYYTSVTADGAMETYWVMPFAKNATIKIHNYGSQDVTVEELSAAASSWSWDDRSMHFGAGWREYRRVPASWSNPRDVNYVTLTGEGRLVGTGVTLFNTVSNWWGEGDEKIYVDGSTFPEFFGTGTEDFFGYAWCLPDVFTNHPFLAQPDGSGNLAPGYTVNERYRALDAIPFDTSLVFDMEIFSFKGEGIINYAPVNYWYMRPGGKSNLGVDIDAVRLPVARRASDITSPDAISEGALEGADLRRTASQGSLEAQGDSGWGLSNGRQLFWRGGEVGATLDVILPISEAGTYDLALALAHAPDYGIYQVSLNGQNIGVPVNAYATDVVIRSAIFSAVPFKAGDNTLRFTITGADPKADAGSWFLGLDTVSILKDGITIRKED